MRKLSLRAKMLGVSGLIAGVIIFASVQFFLELKSSSRSAQSAVRVLIGLDQVNTYFDQMTVGMRGYILDPTRTEEWNSKLKADELAVAKIEEVIRFSTDSRLTAVLEEIGEYDEKTMNRLENEFGDLIDKQQAARAQKFYFESYVPARGKMEKMLGEARDLANRDKEYFEAHANEVLVNGGGILLFVIVGSLLGAFFYNQSVANNVTGTIYSFTDKLSSSVMSIELASKNTASASQQIATSATENASAITETLSISESGKKESEKGISVVTRMSDAMAQVSEANSKLESLIKVIEDIQSKTKVINDIVFETRLLSFNASIEAARAGTHGKGFAVVAEEVGKLAAVSGKAAEEINSLLATSTHQVKEVVSLTSHRVGAAREASTQCEQVFTQMSHSMTEINRAMMDMERETHHNSASSEEMANQAQTLAHEARALTGLLGQLRRLVSGSAQSEQGGEFGGSDSHAYSTPVRHFPNPGSGPSPVASVHNVTPIHSTQPGDLPTGDRVVDRNDNRWKAA